MVAPPTGVVPPGRSRTARVPQEAMHQAAIDVALSFFRRTPGAP